MTTMMMAGMVAVLMMVMLMATTNPGNIARAGNRVDHCNRLRGNVGDGGGDDDDVARRTAAAVSEGGHEEFAAVVRAMKQWPEHCTCETDAG